MITIPVELKALRTAHRMTLAELAEQFLQFCLEIS